MPSHVPVVGEKEYCECCGQSISSSEVALNNKMVRAMMTVLKWAKKNNQFEFRRRDFGHLFTDETMTARFGDWIYFGSDFLYHPEDKKGWWRFNVPQAEMFIHNQLRIPIRVRKYKGRFKRWDVIETGTIRDVKNLTAFLDANYRYIVRVFPPQDYSRSQQKLI